MLFFKSSICRLISSRLAVLCELDFLPLPTPVDLFATSNSIRFLIYVFLIFALNSSIELCTMPRKKKSLEDKLVKVKIDEALIQNDRYAIWTQIRGQYTDLVFAEKRNAFIYGFLTGSILMFAFLMAIASI